MERTGNHWRGETSQTCMWTIDQGRGAAIFTGRSLRINQTTAREAMPAKQASKRDVSKLKPIGSTFCTQYQSDAKFYLQYPEAPRFAPNKHWEFSVFSNRGKCL